MHNNAHKIAGISADVHGAMIHDTFTILWIKGGVVGSGSASVTKAFSLLFFERSIASPHWMPPQTRGENEPDEICRLPDKRDLFR